jgi:regulator of extracellular matrix RemA (YlzA/DUF370 family)
MENDQNTNIQPTGQTMMGYMTENRSVLLIILACIGLLLGLSISVAAVSLPGERFYTVKTDMIEPSLQMLHITKKDKAWYQVTKMKTRMEEVKKLATQESVTEKALTDSITQINLHTATLDSFVVESIDSAFPKTDILYTLNEFTSVAGAIESVGEHTPTLQKIGDAAEESRQTIESTYKLRIRSFVQTETPQTALAYIQEELIRVKNELGNSDLNKKTVRIAGNYLDRVEPALVKSDYYRTILSIGEAYRVVAIAKYAGVTIEDTQETKQNTATSTPEDVATTSLQSTSTILQ